MPLNKDQNIALQHVVEGHNVLILGPAGTGKSFLLKEIHDSLVKNGKTVYITASTGIASSRYKKAMTIHRWSGIGDGRHNLEDLKEIIKNNKQYTDVKARLFETDILIVDEISMISKRLFECLNTICQLKNPQLLFGGIQLVFAGDFRQLPPVPNPLYGDEGEYCFHSQIFKEMFPHTISLKEVVRQNEATFINAIEECSMGNLSVETIQLVQSLKRPLPEEPDKHTTMLFSTNEMVDDFNRKKILEYPGQMYEFSSNDSGERRYLDKITVPKILWLKIGAPVILMRNLTDKLVNGLQGYVTGITEAGPVVKFEHDELPVPKVKCTVFNPQKNTDVAVREQFPLKLGFAISIHKSQGMTLNRVEVNCKGIFKPGQFGVAIGRCSHSDGLRVVNFSPRVCIPQPIEVQHFLTRITNLPCLQDKSCCRALSFSEPKTATVTISADTDYENTVDDEEFDAEFDSYIQQIDDIQNENQSVELPEDLNLDNILEGIYCKFVVTPQQSNINKILENIDKNRVKRFAQNVYKKLKSLFESQEKELEKSKKVPANKQNEFYHAVHMYLTSLEYRMNCLLLDETSFTEEHLSICFNISTSIRKYLLQKQVDLLNVSKRDISSRTVTNASMSRIRYVGGYCIAKVHHKFLQKKKTAMYKTDSKNVGLYEEAKICVDILSELKENEQYVLSTTNHPDSLLDTERRQSTKNRSLTNISDTLFEFFKDLTELCLKLLTDELLNKYGNNFCEYVRNEIQKDDKLRLKFYSVVNQCSLSSIKKQTLEEHSEIIYKKIIKLHLMVMLNQFRKDVLEKFNIEKKMSHRKQIQVSGKGKGKAKVNQGDEGKPETKTSRKVKDKQGDERKAKTKKSQKPRKRKHDEESDSDVDINKNVKTSVAPEEVHPFALSTPDSPQAGTSGITEDPNITPDQENEEEVDCLVCLRPSKVVKGKEETDWIQCDSCDGWTHRSCAGLNHHLKWRKATSDGSVYYCKQCE